MDFAFLISWSLCRKSDARIERGFKARFKRFKCASSALSLSRYRIGLERRESIRKKTKRKERRVANENSNRAGFVGSRWRSRLGILRLALTAKKRRGLASFSPDLSHRFAIYFPDDFILVSNSLAGGRYAGDMTIIKVADNPRRSPTCLSVSATILSLLRSSRYVDGKHTSNGKYVYRY